MVGQRSNGLVGTARIQAHVGSSGGIAPAALWRSPLCDVGPARRAAGRRAVAPGIGKRALALGGPDPWEAGSDAGSAPVISRDRPSKSLPLRHRLPAKPGFRLQAGSKQRRSASADRDFRGNRMRQEEWHRFREPVGADVQDGDEVARFRDGEHRLGREDVEPRAQPPWSTSGAITSGLVVALLGNRARPGSSLATESSATAGARDDRTHLGPLRGRGLGPPGAVARRGTARIALGLVLGAPTRHLLPWVNPGIVLWSALLTAAGALGLAGSRRSADDRARLSALPRRRDQLIRRSRPPHSRSRNTNFCVLPVLVFGS
jgi:hypothetical protein